jgi:hypothetical protein
MFITVFTRAGESVKSKPHLHAREAVTTSSTVFFKKWQLLSFISYVRRNFVI